MLCSRRSIEVLFFFLFVVDSATTSMNIRNTNEFGGRNARALVLIRQIQIFCMHPLLSRNYVRVKFLVSPRFLLLKTFAINLYLRCG
jgi:hypothetical protein